MPATLPQSTIDAIRRPAAAPPPRRAEALTDRVVAATWQVRDLAERAPHDSGCPSAAERSSEFACRCSLGKLYTELQETLRDAHAALDAKPPLPGERGVGQGRATR